MRLTISFLLLMLVAGGLVSGCYNKPVRHLASDVALLKVGVSTMEDVLVYLGDPDERQEIEGGEVWFYHDEDRNLLESTPYVGKHFGSPELRQVVVRIQSGIVTGCKYTSSDADDLDWADDFSWQEKAE